MENLLEKTSARLVQIESIIKKLEASISRAPEGNLRIDWNNGQPRYFKKGKNDKKWHFIYKRESEVIPALAQRQYDEKVLRQLHQEKKALTYFNEHYPAEELNLHFDNLHSARKALITPHFISDSEYAQRWQAEQYIHRTFDENAPSYIGPGNQHFRSKSEIIIAQLLTEAKIPFHYEYPLQTADDRVFYPDFLCLNVRTRQEFYWEHFGMMGNEDYASKVVKKLTVYNQNGMEFGKNLLFTMETESVPLDTLQVERLIETYLK